MELIRLGRYLLKAGHQDKAREVVRSVVRILVEVKGTYPEAACLSLISSDYIQYGDAYNREVVRVEVYIDEDTNLYIQYPDKQGNIICKALSDVQPLPHEGIAFNEYLSKVGDTSIIYDFNHLEGKLIQYTSYTFYKKYSIAEYGSHNGYKISTCARSFVLNIVEKVIEVDMQNSEVVVKNVIDIVKTKGGIEYIFSEESYRKKAYFIDTEKGTRIIIGDELVEELTEDEDSLIKRDLYL